MVRTEGADGALHDYQVSHTFGVYPLQQYLIPFPRGRMQVLGVCWDSRPKEQGGQRWYHLYDEEIKNDDPLHWTGRHQNWNFMCASCHSTNLRKNYSVETDTYKTTWSEIDVSCETCHGPASHHVAWAEKAALGKAPRMAHHGFRQSLRKDSQWVFEKGKPTATRRGSKSAHHQTESCARCHSRRTTICEGPAGERLLDSERVSLLHDPNLYFPDGQIKDEVYVYGSFAQSKMYHAGRHLHGLPRRALAQDPRTRQRTVRALPRDFDVRYPRTPSPPSGQCWGAVRRVPHADADLHGGGRSPRPQHPHPPAQSSPPRSARPTPATTATARRDTPVGSGCDS